MFCGCVNAACALSKGQGSCWKEMMHTALHSCSALAWWLGYAGKGHRHLRRPVSTTGSMMVLTQHIQHLGTAENKQKRNLQAASGSHEPLPRIPTISEYSSLHYIQALGESKHTHYTQPHSRKAVSTRRVGLLQPHPWSQQMHRPDWHALVCLSRKTPHGSGTQRKGKAAQVPRQARRGTGKPKQAINPRSRSPAQ